MRSAVLAMLALGSATGVAVAVLTQDFSGTAAPERAEAPKPPTTEVAARPPGVTFDPRFQACAHCHQIGPGARRASGPVLTGLLGRKAASTDYPYSKAMRASGIVWDEAALRRFLRAPQSVVPGTRMAFGGMRDEAALDGLIEFLKGPGR